MCESMFLDIVFNIDILFAETSVTFTNLQLFDKWLTEIAVIKSIGVEIFSKFDLF